MTQMSIEEQINVLKHNRDVEISVSCYKESEAVCSIKSKIRGYAAELDYYEKQKDLYELLMQDSERNNDENQIKYYECLDIVDKLVVIVNNLSMQLIDAENEYLIARSRAEERANNNYNNKVQKIITNIKHLSETQEENE